MDVFITKKCTDSNIAEIFLKQKKLGVRGLHPDLLLVAPTPKDYTEKAKINTKFNERKLNIEVKNKHILRKEFAILITAYRLSKYDSLVKNVNRFSNTQTLVNLQV